jgi:hypothetical protein
MATNKPTRKRSSTELGSGSISGMGVRRVTVGAEAGMVVSGTVSGEAVI